MILPHRSTVCLKNTMNTPHGASEVVRRASLFFHLRNGFSLIELVVAMTIGIMVALGAYMAFRTAAQSIAIVNRLALENQLMRTGVAQILHDADFWTTLDEPEDATQQDLRLVATRHPWYAPTATEGFLFAPLKSIPIEVDWQFNSNNPGSDNPTEPASLQVRPWWSIRPTEPILETAIEMGDDQRVFSRDFDRGWDALRPYAAGDPRSWYRGNLGEEGKSNKHMGRYALLSNQRKYPILGYGRDAHINAGWNARWAGYGQGWADIALGWQRETGPFGPTSPAYYQNNPSRTFTWRDDQTEFLYQALGLYGMFDYLPSNSVYSAYGSWMLGNTSGPSPEPAVPAVHDDGTLDPNGGLFVRNDERMDYRFSGFSNKYKEGNASPLSLGDRAQIGLFSTGETYPILPWSRYTGIANVAIASKDGGIGGWFLLVDFPGFWSRSIYSGDDGEEPNPRIYGSSGNSSDPNSVNYIPASSAASWKQVHAWLGFHRCTWPGETEQPHILNQLWYRSTQVRPIARQKPDTWPDLHISSSRLLWRAHFMNLATVRWTDLTTGDVAELKFNALGTTLRGARQQRHQQAGWATFRGVSYDRVSGRLYDNPRHPGMSGYNLAEDNDPTLDAAP